MTSLDQQMITGEQWEALSDDAANLHFFPCFLLFQRRCPLWLRHTDTKEIADKMIRKMIGLRIFEDEQGKTNLSLADVDGGLLLVSQFTLYANCKRGNRPSFIEAGKPDMANEMYEYIIEKCRESVDEVQTGEFGADMKVQLLNDGPFTILLDSDQL